MLFIERIHLDFRQKTPLYLQLADQLRAQIVSGQLQADDQLPPVRSLAGSLRVNFNTVARAYRVLDIEGWISSQQGRGTYITPQSWPYTLPEQTAAPLPQMEPIRRWADDRSAEENEHEGAQSETPVASWLAQAQQAGLAAEEILAYLLDRQETTRRPGAAPVLQPRPNLPTAEKRKNTRHAGANPKRLRSRERPAKIETNHPDTANNHFSGGDEVPAKRSGRLRRKKSFRRRPGRRWKMQHENFG